MVGHFVAAVPGQRPPRVCRQLAHAFDQHAGHRVGLVPVGSRDDHGVAGGAVDGGWRPPMGALANTRSPSVAGHLPGVGPGRPLVDADHVADPAPTVPAPLAARPSIRTIGPQTVKHAGVEDIPRRHGHITVDRLVRDPRPLGDLLR
jgi:hypothetical protein